MQLYLIRHAQSENNALWDNGLYEQMRKIDPELTEIGKRQSQVLAEFLARRGAHSTQSEDDHNRSGFGLTHLYCSLMVRAVATGAAIADQVELPLVAWPDWHEGGGIYHDDPATGGKVGYPGKNRAYYLEHYPQLLLPPSLNENGWWNRPFEERPQRWERARRVLGELHARHADSDDRVGVVMHGGFYNYFLKTLLGLEPAEEIWFVISNAAITRIDFLEQETRLVYQNRLDFMPFELLSAG